MIPHPGPTAVLLSLVAFLVPAVTVASGGAMPSEGPDVVVADLFDSIRWGEVGGISAYSFGTNVCNVGDEELPWVAETNAHPVISHNLYRIRDDRFEQIGISWVKHGFGALALNRCGDCQAPGGTEALGVGCSDPYTADLNGDQGGFFGIAGLGPRAEVNAFTGGFPFPYRTQGEDGDAIYKRVQVRNEDIDPELNAGAAYVLEGQYVTPDDAQAGNQNNNASYRPVRVTQDLEIEPVSFTRPARPAIYGWAELDPAVEVVTVDIPDEGQLTVAYKVTDLGGSSWRYEYAVHNLSSHRSVRGFELPIDADVSLNEIGFHDVDYHSGEPFDSTDWAVTLPTPDAASLVWATDAFTDNPLANALRWGTTYNFRFVADRPPGSAAGQLLLFRPGTPAEVAVTLHAPESSG